MANAFHSDWDESNAHDRVHSRSKPAQCPYEKNKEASATGATGSSADAESVDKIGDDPGVVSALLTTITNKTACNQYNLKVGF